MTDKQKNSILIVVFLFILFISYKFSIKKTIDLKSTTKKLELEKELLLNANSRIFTLQQENSYLDSILKKKELSIENSFQQTLLKRINNFSEKSTIDIISFQEPHVVKINNAQSKTYSFEVKGNFYTLLQLLHYLEKQQLGKILSANFEKKKNYRKNKNELTVIIFIEKYSQESN